MIAVDVDVVDAAVVDAVVVDAVVVAVVVVDAVVDVHVVDAVDVDAVDVDAIDVDVDVDVAVAVVDAVVVDFGLPVMRLDQKLSPQQQMPRKSFASVTHIHTHTQINKQLHPSRRTNLPTHTQYTHR